MNVHVHTGVTVRVCPRHGSPPATSRTLASGPAAATVKRLLSESICRSGPPFPPRVRGWTDRRSRVRARTVWEPYPRSSPRVTSRSPPSSCASYFTSYGKCRSTSDEWCARFSNSIYDGTPAPCPDYFVYPPHEPSIAPDSTSNLDPTRSVPRPSGPRSPGPAPPAPDPASVPSPAPSQEPSCVPATRPVRVSSPAPGPVPASGPDLSRPPRGTDPLHPKN